MGYYSFALCVCELLQYYLKRAGSPSLNRFPGVLWSRGVAGCTSAGPETARADPATASGGAVQQGELSCAWAPEPGGCPTQVGSFR